MTDRLHYRGFASTPKYSAEDDMFYGLLDDVDAIVIYDSETAAGLKAAFMEAVDDYLDFCDESMTVPAGRAMALAQQRKEVLAVREICPSCGKGMVVTEEAFEVNGDAMRGIPHLLCRSCGEVTFTPEQLDMVFGYRTAQKQLKLDAVQGGGRR